LKFVPLVLLGSLLTTAHAADALPTGSIPGFCDAPVASVWQGLGVGPGTTDDWQTAANWDGGVPSDGDACIPEGGQPRIEAGEEEHLRTIDVAKNATVHVDSGGKLFLFGDQSADEDSIIRRNGTIDVVSGTFGGIGHLHVLGTLRLKNDGSGAATMLTRDCSYDSTPGPEYPFEEDCTSPTPTPVAGPTFLAEIDDYGLLDIDGGGINLGDQVRVRVRGTFEVRADAYVAVDHGVAVSLRAHRTGIDGTGTLQFDGDGGFLEGKIQADTGIASLATLDNRGMILKTAGTGTTLVSAAYSQPSPGAVEVQEGTLLLPTGSVKPAAVGSGATYGTGKCTVPDDPACVPTTSTSFRQAANLTVPTVDADGANVVVRKLSTKSTSADVGFPFVVHATSLTAGPYKPAIIRMRFDSTILAGRTAATLKVYRQATTSSPYRYVKACSASNLPPTGEKSCVDRDASASASSGQGGDVVMIIRTSTTSRWVGR
jgi:hypothetical protein